jgi:hypothetical protein
MTCKPSIGASALVTLLMSAGVALAADDSADPKHIIAAKVRAQGYQCNAPKSAKRDPGFTAPGEIGWMLECEDASYRVMLVPHLAARVERTDRGGHAVKGQ